ncbi:MAG: biotin transporter BioY [Oscillospiraceae bacterium]|nr:biotin transporter BioY [Oscillospiraceae bacterium]
MRKISTRDICLISIFVALIISLSQLALPLPRGVPLTLQTFIVPFSATILGARRGAIAAIAYLLLGAVGLPVFAGFGGGLGRLIGPWGGFLLSYPIMAFVVGFAADKQRKYWLVVGLVCGSLLNLTMGMVQFAIVTGQSLWAAFLAAMMPFFLPEAIKMIMVFLSAPGIRKAFSKNGMLADEQGRTGAVS